MKAARVIAAVGVCGVLMGVYAVASYAVRVPRPDISLPKGDEVTSVRGTCWGGGSESFRCETGESGVRSLLTVSTDRERRVGEPLLRAELARSGFLPSRNGVDTKGFGPNGVAVDEKPVLYCAASGAAGCLGLVSWSSDAYVLAWYPGS
jgi:hypothetical protein